MQQQLWNASAPDRATNWLCRLPWSAVQALTALNRLATRSQGLHGLMLSDGIGQPTGSGPRQLLIPELMRCLKALYGLQTRLNGSAWAARQLPAHDSPSWGLCQAIVSLLCTLLSGSTLACCQVSLPLPSGAASLCARCGDHHKHT